jgi:surface antigen
MAAKFAILLAAGTMLAGCVTASGPAQRADDPSSEAIAARVIAAMEGGLVGGPVGAELSETERRRALEAEYRALEYTPAGEAVAWGTEGGAGGYGEVTAAQPYSVGSQNCRLYTLTVTAKGRTQQARGSACRNPDGSWSRLG